MLRMGFVEDVELILGKVEDVSKVQTLLFNATLPDWVKHGYIEIKERSLLTSMENYVTLLLEIGRPIYTQSHAYGVLRRFLPEEKVEAVKGLSITANGNGAIFDVLAEDLDTYLAGQENATNVSLEVLKALSHLQERDQSRGVRFGGGRGGFGDTSGGNRFGGRGGGNGGFSNQRYDRFSNNKHKVMLCIMRAYQILINVFIIIN